jgi:hypothetical protein
MKITFDIIYEIYFHIDDYITACNFWLLCKAFTKDYMKYYNRSYNHKFKILFNNLFTFLVLLPENTNNNYYRDLDFYEMISTQCLNNYDTYLIKNDIRFIYNLYKAFFTYIYNMSSNLSAIILLQGPIFINNFTILDLKKNNVKILPKYNSKINALRNFMKYYNRYNYNWVNTQIEYLQQSI